MSEKNVKMILSSSILVPDKMMYTMLKAEDHFPFCPPVSIGLIDTLNMNYEPNIRKVLNYIVTSWHDFAYDTTLRVDFIKSHINMYYYILAMYSNKAVLKKYIKDINGFRISENIVIKFDSRSQLYIYVGERCRNTNIPKSLDDYFIKVYSNFEDARSDLLIGADSDDIIRIYKMSTNHLGGPEWTHGDFVHLDHVLYIDIMDKLAKLSGEEYYNYCMQLIEYEAWYIDPVSGHTTDVIWYMNGCKEFRKSKYEFITQEIFQQMLDIKYPILWSHDNFRD